MFKKILVLFLSSMFMLASCQMYNQTEGNVADVKIRAQEARRKSDCACKGEPSLLMKKGMYVDTTPISVDKEPCWLRNHIVIRGDQLPFSYYSRTITGGAGTVVLNKYQVGLDPSTLMTMSYSGSIKGAMDMLAAKTGYIYTINRNLVYWQAYITKTFDIAFMPGGTEYLMGKASAGAGTSASAVGGNNGSAMVSNYTTSDQSDSEYSSLKGTLSVWKDLDTTIKQLLSPNGKVMVSESTTSVTVRDHAANVELIGQYIANLNHNLSKQVLVKVQVLQVNLRSDLNYGIDWHLIANAFNKSPFVLNANYGTPITIQPLAGQNTITGAPLQSPQVGVSQLQDIDLALTPGARKIPGYIILLNALSQQGKASIVTEPRVVALNNQVSVIRIVTQNGYLASVQNTSLSGTSGGNSTTGTVTSQLTPGTVVTGLTLYILPKILGDKIFLQVNADLSVNDGFQTFPSLPTGGATDNVSRIQLPNVSSKTFNQRSVIKSGATLVLAGFRNLSNTANAMQFGQIQALGGKGASQLNQETVVLITPIILHGCEA